MVAWTLELARRFCRFQLTLLCLPVFLAFVEPATALTVVVGGRGSVNDRLPGIRETARWIAAPEDPLWFPLPLVPNPIEYGAIEQRVYDTILEAINGNEPVFLLGYSHGAQLILQVAHRLAGEPVSLQNVTMVTVDRIQLGYPAVFPYPSVPVGINRALNIRQTFPFPLASLQGGEVLGAEEVPPVNETIGNERAVGRYVAHPGILPIFQTDDFHSYIKDSFAVRRAILKWILPVVNYVGGIWWIRLQGTIVDLSTGASRTIDWDRQFVITELFEPFPFDASSYDRDFDLFAGFYGRRLDVEVDGTWSWSYPYCGVAGVFQAVINPTFDESRFSFGPDAIGNCEDVSGYFSGGAVGHLLIQVPE